MIVEQAFWGYKRGHCLIQATIPEDQIDSELSGFTDLPTTLPLEVGNMQPYFSGRAYKGFYVFLKTFPTNNSLRRKGEVFTHALLIKKEDAVKIDNLESVFELFVIEPQVPKGLCSLELKLDVKIELSEKKDHHPLLPNLIVSLLENEETVVWKGVDETTSLIESIWSRLEVVMRSNFAFHLSLSKEDLKSYAYDVVFIPEVLVPKYYGNKLAGEGIDLIDGESLSLNYFLNAEKSNSDFSAFIEGLETSLDKLYQFRKLEDCFFLYQKLETLSLVEIRKLAALIAFHSPDKNKSIEIKKNVLNQLIKETLGKEKVEATDVAGLYNFKHKAYFNGEKLLEGLVKDWISTKMIHLPEEEDEDFFEFCLSKFSKESDSEIWNKGIDKGLKKRFKKFTQPLANFVWRMWCLNDETFKLFKNYLPQNAESKLLINAPLEANRTQLASILKFCKKFNWFTLHGKLVSKAFQSKNAFEQQLEIDKDPNFKKGLIEICKNVNPLDIIQGALLFGDERLIDLASEECIKDSSLLKYLDIEEENWRKIWLESILVSNDVWIGIESPNNVTFGLLNLLLKGKMVNEDLLLRISQTSQGNIWDFNDRPNTWSFLPNSSKKYFLEKTGKHFIQVKINEVKILALETDLQNWIVDNIAKLIPVFPIIKLLTIAEQDNRIDISTFKTILDKKKQEINNNHLGFRIGKIINQRKWHDMASYVFSLTSENANFMYATSECYSLLEMLDYFKFLYLSNNSPSKNEIQNWWKEFWLLCKYIYPSIEHKNIWERSGGDLSNINLKTNGASQWKEALNHIEKGGGKKITVGRLLKEMKNDFPKSKELQVLSKYYFNKM